MSRLMQPFFELDAANADAGRGSRAAGHQPSTRTPAYAAMVAGRCIDRLKEWRGIATRCDKHACHCQAAITLVSTLLWISK